MEHAALLGELLALRDELLTAGDAAAVVHEIHRPGAMNLEHYLSLRSVDRRDLQGRLGEIGASSLGRCESHVLATVDAVIALLTGSPTEPRPSSPPAPSFHEGAALLAANAAALFGDAPASRTTQIMVTLPSEAAKDADLIDDFVQHGMDVARINCAHDDEGVWRAMAQRVRLAARRHSRDVRILMDLGGPKLRTGPIAPGPAVVKLRPERDELGRVRAPALFELVEYGAANGPSTLPTVAVLAPWIRDLQPGDVVHVHDARDANRSWRVVRRSSEGALRLVMECEKTTYVTNGTRFHRGAERGEVAGLPPAPGYVWLSVDDIVTLTSDLTPYVRGSAGSVRLGCEMPEVFGALQSGHRVFLDDGKFEAVVESTGIDEATVRITSAPKRGARLRSEKGINLPDTVIDAPSLTAKDIADLHAVVELADIVGLSFARRAADVEALQRELAERDAAHIGIVLKIETTEGFVNLPALVRTAMRSEKVGVMIARGDLAVEAGYRRVAEVQEEILWLCEAAHLPVIWATEVLSQLAATGRPSRSEITDAAMAERAECVMLNKGPHIPEAIRVLDDILTRMAAHQRKKRALLRALRSWRPAPRATGD